MIAPDGAYAGGIVGRSEDGVDIEDCLNTGMIIAMKMSDVTGSFYNKYKTKSGLTCVTKTYKGKEYVIRKYKADASGSYLGGIIGVAANCTISKCANLGSIYSSDDDGIGGIAGSIYPAKITNCLSDFHGSDGVRGICRFNGNGVSVNNCLNLTTYKDISAAENKWGDFKGEHNYSLTTATDAHHTTKTTAAKIKYGEICLKLGENWEQNLGTDAYPTPTGKKGLYHTRTVSDHYGAVCLPFAMNSDDNVKFYLPTKVNNGEDEVTIRFSYVERLQAGYPALFSVANQGDYTFTPASESDEIRDQPFSILPDLEADWLLHGTYEEIVFEGEGAKERYYISDDKICNDIKATVAPFSSYFSGPDVTTLVNNYNQTKAILIEIEGEDGPTTSLEFVGNDLKPVRNGKTYSIMGIEVDDNYRGIVIKDGKKILRK